VGPIPAALIGLMAAIGCYFGILAKNKFGYDDSLDVVGIHGVGGIIGLIATGLFASTLVNPDGRNGLFFGNPSQVGIQCLAILVTIVYTFIASYILFKAIDKCLGLRVPEDEEMSGLDLSQHDEMAYNL